MLKASLTVALLPLFSFDDLRFDNSRAPINTNFVRIEMVKDTWKRKDETELAPKKQRPWFVENSSK